jgi:hypothetical protein
MSGPHIERIRALEQEILRLIDTQQHSPVEGFCACWAAFARVTAAMYGEDVARQVRDLIKSAAQQKDIELLASLPPAGEA